VSRGLGDVYKRQALDGLLARIRQPVDIGVQLDIAQDLLVGRLSGRAHVEGRADDSPETVRKRLTVYAEQTAPVVDYYRNQGKLVCVQGAGTVDEVFIRILEALSPAPDVG
jgi:adenylate kinase